MGDFAIDHSLRDDADDMPAGRESRVGDGAHQADAGAAVDHVKPALGKQAADAAGGIEINRIAAGTRAAEDADAFHHGSIMPRFGRARRRVLANG